MKKLLGAVVRYSRSGPPNSCVRCAHLDSFTGRRRNNFLLPSGLLASSLFFRSILLLFLLSYEHNVIYSVPVLLCANPIYRTLNTLQDYFLNFQPSPHIFALSGWFTAHCILLLWQFKYFWMKIHRVVNEKNFLLQFSSALLRLFFSYFVYWLKINFSVSIKNSMNWL